MCRDSDLDFELTDAEREELTDGRGDDEQQPSC